MKLWRLLWALLHNSAYKKVITTEGTENTECLFFSVFSVPSVVIFSLLLCTSFMLFSAPPIVFIHLGSKLPPYVPTAIANARLFNPDSPIYLVANSVALLPFSRTLKPMGVSCIAHETLGQSALHAAFIDRSRPYRIYREPFWRYSLERFFVLYDLMQEHKLTDVIHLENDVMLYCELDELMPCFQAHYQNKIGATFDNDGRCIAGFVYIATQPPLAALLEFINHQLRTQTYDMFYLAEFRRNHGGVHIDNLPIVSSFYANEHELITPQGHRAVDAAPYFRHFAQFNSIFDAAALGQYLGGIDPIHGASQPGFINESCVFNPAAFQYEWVSDARGRRVPYLNDQGRKCRINNLHIHSKNLQPFRSSP